MGLRYQLCRGVEIGRGESNGCGLGYLHLLADCGFAFGALAREGIELSGVVRLLHQEPPVIDGDLAEWEHLTPLPQQCSTAWLQGFGSGSPGDQEPVIALPLQCPDLAGGISNLYLPQGSGRRMCPSVSH